MKKKIAIYCRNVDRYIDVEGGETLLETAGRLSPELGFRPVCARVNNKTESLSYAVYQPKQVEFLSKTMASGERVYVRSLCMMLYRAVTRLYPGVSLRFEHSISHGYYGRLEGMDVGEAEIDALRSEMRRMVDQDIPFERCEMLTSDVVDIFSAQGLVDKVMLMRSTGRLYTTFYRLDGIWSACSVDRAA